MLVVRKGQKLRVMWSVVVAKQRTLFVDILIAVDLFHRASSPQRNLFGELSPRTVLEVQGAVNGSCQWIVYGVCNFVVNGDAPADGADDQAEVLVNMPHVA